MSVRMNVFGGNSFDLIERVERPLCAHPNECLLDSELRRLFSTQAHDQDMIEMHSQRVLPGPIVMRGLVRAVKR